MFLCASHIMRKDSGLKADKVIVDVRDSVLQVCALLLLQGAPGKWVLKLVLGLQKPVIEKGSVRMEMYRKLFRP